jgi:peroxiredoxin
MSDKRIEVGETARDFTLEDTEGEKVTLSQFEGKEIVYLIFNRGFS